MKYLTNVLKVYSFLLIFFYYSVQVLIFSQQIVICGKAVAWTRPSGEEQWQQVVLHVY
jgi:hypothetical protein